MVGLRRHRFPPETIRALKKAYRIIFRSGLTLDRALKSIQGDGIYQMPEVQHLIEFIQHSKRGINR